MLAKEAEQAFSAGDYSKCVSCYAEAIELVKDRKTDASFDFHRFMAGCYSGLTGALGKLGKHEKCLELADAALSFFEKVGDLYPVLRGKWLMAIVNKGTALVCLGRPEEALPLFERAKRMAQESGTDSDEKQHWMIMVEQNIESVKKLLDKQKKGKRVWLFWR